MLPAIFLIVGYGMMLWQRLAALYAKTGKRKLDRARFESDALHQIKKTQDSVRWPAWVL